MSTEMKRLEDTPIEALAILANEEAENAAKQWQQATAIAKSSVRSGMIAGKCLNIIKSRLAHGQWLPWLEENWQHDRKWATTLMRIANGERAPHLEHATSIRECVRIMGELDEAAGTKRTRKAPAEPAPEVIDNRPAPKPVEDVPTITKSFVDSDDLPPEEPPALPKTNTLHSPATRQQIDRGPEPFPARPAAPAIRCDGLEDGAWYVYRSGKEPAFRLLSKKEILETAIAVSTTPQVLQALADGYEGDQKKRVARQMREAADKLDPQPVVIHHQEPAPRPAKPGKHPSADQLMDKARTYVTAWSGQLMTQVCKWAEYKQSLAGNAKVRSLASWDAMLTRIDNVQKMRGPGTVCEMINKAIANGWQGWEHDSGSNGKPTVASTRIDHGEDYSDLEYRTT
jgi:hypothetical protein